jgi:hypothetical protein
MVVQRLKEVHFEVNPNKCCFGAQSDAPPNSFIDSNVNPKVKTMEEGVGVHSFAHNISRVRRACWNFGMGIKMSDK